MITRPGCSLTLDTYLLPSPAACFVFHLRRCIIDGGVRGGKPTVLRALSALDTAAHHFGLAPEQLIRLLDIILQGKIGMVDIFTRDT